MKLLAATALLSTALATPPSKRASTVLIPKSVFDNTSSLEQYFTYNYPWGGDTHNGGARMTKAQVSIATAGTLQITASPSSNQPPATHGGKQIPIHYLSGAIGAKQHFTVPAAGSGGLRFTASFLAPVARGTWPAFWLTGVAGWPPEIDMAEWKGSGKISFNTFNTSSVVAARDVGYVEPGKWHEIRCEVRGVGGGGGSVEVKYWMDGKAVVTQWGKGYVGKEMYLVINLQMEGSSGSPGPKTATTYSIRELEVVTI
ncbi:hypothetical protein DE146DRAFT_770389 [Phaeosphaeria sp. MPI-PUGE-AT-0046c]|nr:hypothetical protein DE146DRAFT_770389 [Phaeosphaeria sp. MPI-PUGE-AT-0046c]